MSRDSAADPSRPRFGRWMGTMWLYSGLRFGMFFALWGVLYLCGLHGFAAPLIALLASVPLALVLLRKPRQAFSAQLEARVTARQVDRQALDTRLESTD